MTTPPLEATTRDHWFNTFSGVKFSYIDMDPDTIDIKDIAHALSMLCRYNGHIARFYSVAQHSVYVSIVAAGLYRETCMGEETPRALEMLELVKFWGLMHDATEAYMGDMVRPLKVMIPAYSEMEAKLDRVIMTKFVGQTIPSHIHALIKEADNQVLASEVRDLVPVVHPDWDFPWPATLDYVGAWNPNKAERLFMERFELCLATVRS